MDMARFDSGTSWDLSAFPNPLLPINLAPSHLANFGPALPKGDLLTNVVLPVFRVTAVSWVVARYPVHARELADPTLTAAGGPASYAATYTGRAEASAASAFITAADAIGAAEAADKAANAAASAAGAVRAAALANDGISFVSAPTSTVTFWSAVSTDATRVEEGVAASDIAGSPLWPEDQPDQLRSSWQELRAALVAAKDDWDVWTDWYEDRLVGRVRDEERELAYVRIGNELCDRGPAIVNAEIKRRIEELEPPSPAAELWTLGISSGENVGSPSLSVAEPKPSTQMESVLSHWAPFWPTSHRTELKDERRIEEPRPWTDTLANLPEVPLGNKWIEKGDRLAIDPSGQETDDAAARDPVVCQLHEAVKRKAREFAAAEAGIDERLGWTGFDDVIRRFLAAVDVATAAIPSQIATVYDATIELASFLDVDGDLRQRPGSNISQLDPITRRSFLDLIRTAAPWVRRFPTARALDDETGAFLLRRDLYEPSLAIVEGACDTALISAEDRALLKGLLSASEREGAPAHKAGTRGVQSTKSLTIAAITIVAGLYITGIEFEFANHSLNRAGDPPALPGRQQ